MPSFLLDTHFCIHFIRGRAWARSALARLQVLDVAISAVTVGELYEGAHRSDFPTKEAAKAEAFLKPFEVIPLGREEAMEWGLIEARLRKEVDRPRPNRATGGERRFECGADRKGLPEGGVRGRTQRLGKARLPFAGARGASGFAAMGLALGQGAVCA